MEGENSGIHIKRGKASNAGAPDIAQVSDIPQDAKPVADAPKGPPFANPPTVDPVVESADLNLMTPRSARVAQLKKDKAAAALDKEAGDRLHGQIQRSKPWLVRVTDWVFGTTIGRALLLLCGAAAGGATVITYRNSYRDRQAERGL